MPHYCYSELYTHTCVCVHAYFFLVKKCTLASRYMFLVDLQRKPQLIKEINYKFGRKMCFDNVQSFLMNLHTSLIYWKVVWPSLWIVCRPQWSQWREPCRIISLQELGSKLDCSTLLSFLKGFQIVFFEFRQFNHLTSFIM